MMSKACIHDARRNNFDERYQQYVKMKVKGNKSINAFTMVTTLLVNTWLPGDTGIWTQVNEQEVKTGGSRMKLKYTNGIS